MTTTRIAQFCLFALLFCAVNTAHAEKNLFARRQGGQNVVGIKLGFVNGATFRLNYTDSATGSVKAHSRAGVMGGLFFDMHISQSSSISFATDIIDIVVNNDREKFLDLSLAFKHRISSPEAAMILRPAVGAGLGYMADINFLKASSYLTLKAYCEMLIRTERPHSYLLELGVVGSPNGGNSRIDVHITPMVYMRVGIVY